MLRIDIRNLSHLNRKSNYEYKAMVTMKDGGIKIIAEGTVEGHIRENGWRALVRQILDESKDIG